VAGADHHRQHNGRPRKHNNNNKKISRLSRLLAQPDIFEALIKIGNGTIKSYDDLDMDAMAK